MKWGWTMVEVKSQLLADLTILIIEDDPDTLKILALIVARNSGKPVTAATAKEGLFQFAQHPIDYILSDILLPDLNGYELWEKIRQTEKGSMIPIIALTSLKDWKDRVKSLRAGADSYVQKPVHELELVETIHALKRYEAMILKRAQVAPDPTPNDAVLNRHVEEAQKMPSDKTSMLEQQINVLLPKLGKRFFRAVQNYRNKEYIRALDLLLQELNNSATKDPALTAVYQQIEEEFTALVMENLGSWNYVPVVVHKQLSHDILTNFKKEEHQVLHLIDGKASFAHIAELANLARWRTLDIMVKFIHDGLVKIRDPLSGNDLFIVSQLPYRR